MISVQIIEDAIQQLPEPDLVELQLTLSGSQAQEIRYISATDFPKSRRIFCLSGVIPSIA